MKKLSALLILLLAVVTVSAQDITGTWTGSLSFSDQMGNSVELGINFNISSTDKGYSSTLDSPDQDTFGIPVDSTIFKKPEITFKVDDLFLEYVGNLVDETNIKGTITQGGQSFELDLIKKTE